MAASLRTAVRALLLTATLALIALPTACGVDFDPDRFCWKCSQDANCGDGYVCQVEGPIGHCVPDELADDESSPCDPPPPAADK